MNRIVSQVKFQTVNLPKLKKVAAYARVSTGKDAMLHSLSAQVSYYSNYIQNHSGWQYAGVYSDEATTGTKDNRNGFQKLLDDCKDGKIDMVITKSISRFARNTVTLLETVRELKSIGVDVYFEEQNIHTMSADGELMLTILASYAQEESLSASENQKWHIRKGFENGELINLRFLYGYTINKGVIEINKKQAEVIRLIFDEYLKGTGCNLIAKKLNEQKIPSLRNSEWDASRVLSILKNEKYTGNALLQKKHRNNHIDKKEIKNKGVLPKYYAEGTHPAIIDIDVFNKAQERIKQQSEKYATGTHTEKSAFTGMLFCPHCGKNYKRMKSNGLAGWNCSTYLTKGKSECKGKKIPETTLISVSNDALGIDIFDENIFISLVRQIIVPSPNHLIFIMSDGRQIEKVWQDHSRKDSWTEQMKAQARQKVILQRSKK